jgi:dipeptidyl aminopeptidase/acylaminoacyl peptidase
VEAQDGLTVYAFHWEANRDADQPRKVLLSVPGGPALKTPVGWDPRRQFLLDSGIDIVLVAYRGQLGFGTAFEHAPGGASARIDDVLTVRRRLMDDLDLSPDDILLYGASYGAMLVANAAARDPSVGDVVLLGLLPSGGVSESHNPGAEAVCVAGFHGALDDRVSPETARREIDRLLGLAALQPPCGSFRIFPDEGHVPSRHTSMNEIVATLVTLIAARADTTDPQSP